MFETFRIFALLFMRIAVITCFTRKGTTQFAATKLGCLRIRSTISYTVEK